MPPSSPTNSRTNQRTSLFAAAVLQSESGVWPVRIRNMSATGALVESSNLPQTGLSVRLCRASLSMKAQVKWVREGRAGLQFNGSADVAAWINSCTVRGHQERLDELIAEVRTSLSSTGPIDRVILDNGIASIRLAAIISQLEEMLGRLSESSYLVKRHAVELQTMDICIADLRRIKTALTAENPE